MKEIERKFLVDTSKWQPRSDGVKIIQGYLSTIPERVVRVRIAGKKSYLAIKGKVEGISRDEFEYQIPFEDAVKLLKICREVSVEKIRYLEIVNGMTWEIDIFEAENSGLVMAEIELEYENQEFDLPYWIEREVTGDKRYYNSWLSENPYSKWK